MILLSAVSRFIHEAQLTQKNRNNTVSWNRVKCCTNVRRIASEEACILWMTFKVIQGHWRCCHLIGHIRFPIVFHCKYIFTLQHFLDIHTYLPKINTSRDFDHAHLGDSLIILLGPTRVQNLAIISSAIPEKFKGCDIKWITWPRPRHFRDGQSSEG